jgi:hypothetical protein
MHINKEKNHPVPLDTILYLLDLLAQPNGEKREDWGWGGKWNPWFLPLSSMLASLPLAFVYLFQLHITMFNPGCNSQKQPCMLVMPAPGVWLQTQEPISSNFKALTPAYTAPFPQKAECKICKAPSLSLCIIIIQPLPQSHSIFAISVQSIC